MCVSVSRLFTIGTLVAFFAAGFVPKASSVNWYVDSTAATAPHDGTSWSGAWTTLGSISWPSLAGGDIIWVRGGPYDERVSVAKRGLSSKARIILKGVGSPVIAGVDGHAFDYIAVIGFEITQVSPANKQDGIRLAGASGWLIEGNYIHDTYGSGVEGHYGTVNNFNVIRGNTFDAICSAEGGVASAPVIQVYGDSNLIEYNNVTKSSDRTRAFGVGNVIRNNLWGATDTTLLPRSSPFPVHTDGFQSYDSTRNLRQFLYERNWDMDNADSVGQTNAHGFIVQNNSATPGLLNWIISRFNVLVRPGGVAYQMKALERVYIYNQTSIGINYSAPNLFRSAVGFDPSTPPGDILDCRNNTWSFSPRIVSNSGVIDLVQNTPTNFTSDYQHSYNISGTQPILPRAAHNLPHKNPLFTNAADDDYTLQPASPLVGTGGPLTTAVGASRDSTSLTVADSKRLFDGWGIAEADSIKIGDGSYVQISSINYETNVVTLVAERSWRDGDAVIVKGMEDVGALPYSYAKWFTIINTTPDHLPAGPATLSATCTNPDAVRKVEALVDGIPVGDSYAPPYSVAWVSDGASHKIEVRAYSAWASRTLWKSESSTVNQPGDTGGAK